MQVFAVRVKVAMRDPGVLRQVATGRSGPTNALDRPITSASGSDLLWAEFVLTGSSAPITRLIGLLDRPDIVRMELQQWLDSWFGRLFGLGRRDVCARLHALAGIDCDPDRRVIETADDLDCLCMMEGVHLDPERFLVTREHLPFRLRGHDMELMGVKATAKWSLASNANRHPAVLTLCEEALVGSEGPQRAALQEIVQAAHDKRRAYEEVMVLLELQ